MPAPVPFDSSDPVDPYLDCARRNGFVHLRRTVPKWIPLLVELRGISLEDFTRLVWLPDTRLRESVRIPAMYRDASGALRRATFCTVHVADPALDRILAALQGHVAGYDLGLPLDAPPRIEHEATDVPQWPHRRAVLSAVIDDAFAYVNQRFLRRDASGRPRSRIEFLWDQRPSESPSTTVAYGVELTRSKIDARLQEFQQAGLVDEDAIYRADGQDDARPGSRRPLARRVSHGTHVMDLACGHDPAQAPDDAPIVAVRLPAGVVADVSGARLDGHVLDGLWYILDRAQRLMDPPLPVVVSLSYALQHGPHDGSSRLEQAIDQLIALREEPLAVVLPAGNNLLARGHAQLTLQPQQTEPLHWRVPPDDRTASYVEIWLPHPTAAEPHPVVELLLVDPTGRKSAIVVEESWWSGPAGAPTAYVAYRAAGVAGLRPLILVALSPTAPLEPLDRSQPLAAPGTWRIELRNPGVGAIEVHAWIRRDDRPLGHPIVGRQSRFDDPRERRFDASGRLAEVDDGAGYVRRACTVSGMATGSRTVVVAGYRRGDGAPARYSAAGPMIEPPGGPPGRRIGRSPDLAAPSDDSPVARGVLAAGNRGAAVAMDGTSVAVPQVARHIESRFRTGGEDARSIAEGEAIAQEAAAAWPAPRVPERIGHGRVQLPGPRSRRSWTG
jgi:hypothetical protein